MQALSVLKSLTELAVSTGVGAIVSNASKAAVPANAHLVKKVTIAFGTFILSSMVAEQAVEYSKGKIDKGIELLEQSQSLLKEAQEHAKVRAEEIKDQAQTKAKEKLTEAADKIDEKQNEQTEE